MRGRCHLCRREEDITYCSACGHSFCAECKRRFFWRGWEFIKQVASGRRDGCCGPVGGGN